MQLSVGVRTGPTAAAVGSSWVPQIADWDAIADGIRAAEELHYHSIWVGERSARRAAASLDEWTTAASIGGMTEAIRVAAAVRRVDLDDPVRVARVVATLDAISGGRVDIVVDLEGDEAQVTRTPDDVAGALALMKNTWAEDEGPAMPAQLDGPPIWIRDTGDASVLDIVAAHADVWVTSAEADELPSRLARLDAACAACGRDPESLARAVERAVLVVDDATDLELWLERAAGRFVPDADAVAARVRRDGLVGSADEIAVSLQTYAGHGVEHVTCWFMDFPGTSSLERVAGEVAPKVNGAW